MGNESSSKLANLNPKVQNPSGSQTTALPETPAKSIVDHLISGGIVPFLPQAPRTEPEQAVFSYVSATAIPMK